MLDQNPHSSLHNTSDASEKSKIEAFALELADLEKRFRAQGAFKPAAAFGLKVTAVLLSLFTLALGLLSLDASWAYFTGALLLGFYYVQVGWFSHDIAHGQILHGKGLRTSLLWAVFAQGLSAKWWIMTHNNEHHAAPNAFRKSADAIHILDSDIDSMPYICWDRSLLTAGQKNSPLIAAWLKIQRLTVWPLLSIIRLYWSGRSLIVGTAKEKVLVIAHYVTLTALALAVSGLQLLPVLTWIMIANLFGGLLIGFFSLVSHAGKEIYNIDHCTNEAEMVVKSTRNLTDSPLIFWLSGGLNFQIEHHLYPSLPRPHFVAISKEVQKIYRKYDQPYEVVSLSRGLQLFYKALAI